MPLVGLKATLTGSYFPNDDDVYGLSQYMVDSSHREHK